MSSDSFKPYVVKDTTPVRADVFERTGIALDEKDPIMAVLVACAQQTEEIGARLLKRVAAAIFASALLAAIAAASASWATWQVAEAAARAERAEWLSQQTNPRAAALLRSA